MSNSHDKLATVKLTPSNTKAVDKRVKLERQILRIPVSRAAIANKAVEVGIKHLNRIEKHVGSSMDALLKQDGLLGGCEAVAKKRLAKRNRP